MVERERAVELLTSLAHDARLEVFRLLVRSGREGLSAGRLADRLGMSATATSFHLNRLRQGGLLHRQRAGRQVIYSADFGAMRDLLDFLGAECCAESPEGCGPDCGDAAVRRRSRDKATT